jgi:hypothetical protein
VLLADACLSAGRVDEGLETADLLEAQQLMLECEAAPGRREAFSRYSYELTTQLVNN